MNENELLFSMEIEVNNKNKRKEKRLAYITDFLPLIFVPLCHLLIDSKNLPR